MRYTYTYKYKNYPDCPKATALSKFWCSPKHGATAGGVVGLLCLGLMVLIIQSTGKETGVFQIALGIIGFAFLMFGGLLVPGLFKLFKISDRVYEKETGKKRA